MHRFPMHALAAISLFAACTPLDAGSAAGDGGMNQQTGPTVLGEGGVAEEGGLGAVDTGLGTPCVDEGTARCSAAGAGARQLCSGGVWTAMESCPSGQICQAKEGAAPSCQSVAEICKGSAGLSVCDGQGNMISCNADGTVGSQQSCASSRLCQLGLAAQHCATCVPKTEFRCTGTLLEVCAPDGQSFVQQEVCATEALCNKVAGMCTSSVCSADKFACDGNTLTQCNANGTAFKSQMPCGSATCDAAGGDCNICEPGQKKCENGMVLTCNATGQGFTASACPSGDQCVGAGQCAACATNNDCSAMTQGCKVGVCGSANTCSAMNAPASTQCTTASAKPGTCSNGTCQCAPQCTGKMCGDDGCGGQCASKCSLLQKCSGTQCVDCTTSLDCPGSLDGCQTGVCTAGVCSTKPASNTTRCNTLTASGMCNNGTCVACVPSCTTGACGSDGCGGTCACASGKSCFSGVCQVPQWGVCQTNTIQSNECGGTNSGGYSCGTFGTGTTLFCVPRPNGSTCPSGTVNFLGYCVVSCTPPPAGSCAFPFSRCEPNPAPTISDLPGICIR